MSMLERLFGIFAGAWLVLLILAALEGTARAGTILSLTGSGCTATSVGVVNGKEYRSYDGTCNNLTDGQADWGAADNPLIRLGTPSYADNISAVRTATNGAALPSARVVSNAVSAQSAPMPNANGVSLMLMQWGQFLDHDIDLSRTGSESMPIDVPANDVRFTDPIPFTRSTYVAGTDSPRQQVNAITAYIDASQIYGSSKAEADALRVERAGGGLGWELKMTYTPVGGLLHYDSTTGMFVSGDERANEQVGLTSMHTLFNREHNRLGAEIQDELEKQSAFMALSAPERDEMVYQETRKAIGAMMQSITYNEFLPALLGSAAPGAAGAYDASVNAGIANEFSTAAYRFGHSTLAPTLWRLDDAGNPIAAGNLPLEQAFFNPDLLMNDANGGIEPILRGLVAQRAQEVDPFIVDAVRNLLFATPMEIGFDLAALNMQRGRDHGLPGYVEMRDVMFGAANSFDEWADLTSVMTDATIDALKSVYADVRDIDLWIGGLAEKHVNGGLLGELFSAIITDQFTRLRDGDRFWYQNTGMFEQTWMDYIESSTLSTLIMRNTTITGLQANAFFVPLPGVLALWLIGLAGIRLGARGRTRG